MNDLAAGDAAPTSWRNSPNALFCLASLIFCVDQLLGPYALVRFHDWFDVVIFSERNFARQILAQGLMGWMPSMGGMPSFVAQKAPYDLINNLSFALLPPWLVKSCLNFLVYWAAGAGMERLLRERFGLGPRSAVLGGFLFLASSIGFNVQLFVHCVPLFIVCHLDLYREIGPWRRLRALCLMLAMMLFSYPAITLIPYSILHFLTLLAFVPGRTRRDTVLLLGSTVLLWTLYALLSLPTFFGLWDYLPNINRVFDIPYTVWTLGSFKTAANILRSIASYTPTTTLAICCAPEMLRDARSRRAGLLLLLYLGITTASMMPEVVTLIHGTFIEKIDFYHFLTPLPFVFVLFCALALENMRREGRLFSPVWLAVACGLTLPWLSTDHWLRNLLFLLAGFAIPLFNAARLPRFLRGRPGLLRGMAAAAVPGTVMVFWSIMFMDVGHVVYARAFESVPELQELARTAKTPFRVGSLDFAPPMALSNGLETVCERKVLFNKHCKRYVLAATKPQWENAPQWMRTYINAPTELYLRFPQDTLSTRRDIIFNPGQPLSADMVHLPMLEAMNVKYILSPKPVTGLEAAAEEVRFVRGRGLPGWLPASLRETPLLRGMDIPVWIYRLRDTFERAYVAAEPVVLDTSEDVERALQNQSAAELRRKAFFAKADLPTGWTPPRQAADASGAVTKLAPGPDAFSCEGETTGPAVVVVSNNWDKNWRARVNGQEAQLLRCNLAFQAVVLPTAGHFRLELEYHNPVVWWLHLVSGAALLGLAALAFCYRCRVAEPMRPARPTAAAALPRGPVLRGGLGITAIWSVAFFLGRCLKEPLSSPRPVFYTLVYTLVLGVLFTFWWLRAEARFRNPDEDAERRGQ